jgi:hypothetical protein
MEMNKIDILMNIKNDLIEIVTQSTNEYILALGELEKIRNCYYISYI